MPVGILPTARQANQPSAATTRITWPSTLAKTTGGIASTGGSRSSSAAAAPAGRRRGRRDIRVAEEARERVGEQEDVGAEMRRVAQVARKEAEEQARRAAGDEREAPLRQYRGRDSQRPDRDPEEGGIASRSRKKTVNRERRRSSVTAR